MLKNFLQDKQSSYIHIIGIAGVGMSGIAQILHQKGIRVQGSDAAKNYYSDKLKELGIQVFHDQEKSHITKGALVVKSSAIKDEHNEIKFARQNNIPVIKRSEILSEITKDYFLITVAGAHGKTSTTGWLFTVLKEAERDPSVLNGGWINSISSNAYLGSSKYFVAEADESDGTFLELSPKISIVTNIEAEHLDYYGTVEKLEESYMKYMHKSSKSGFCIYCYDCPTNKKIASKLEQQEYLISYGFNQGADLRLINVIENDDSTTFDLLFSKRCNSFFDGKVSTEIKGFKVNLLGNHNLLNSTAVITASLILKISIEQIKKGLIEYKGVKRRFSKIEHFDNINFIDDYAHHPTEVMATLNTARKFASNNNGKVIAVFQPHRFSRLKDLWYEFAAAFEDADTVIITDVYSAGESPIDQINSKNLATEVVNMKNTSHDNEVFYCENIEKELASIIQGLMKAGDYIVFMGAGDITVWASCISKKLKELSY